MLRMMVSTSATAASGTAFMYHAFPALSASAKMSWEVSE